MFDFDGDGEFGSSDAAAVGGLMGFAEESMRAEEFSDEDLDSGDVEDLMEKQLKHPNLRLIYNMNPQLFKFIVRRVIEQQKNLRKQRLAREEAEALAEDEFGYELIALEETEGLENSDE